MLFRKRENAAGVGRAVKERRLETCRAMTGRAIGAGCPRSKLPLMWIQVAVAAERMQDRARKITLLMALLAGQGRVLSDQPKARDAVIEAVGCALKTVGIVAPFAPASLF